MIMESQSNLKTLFALGKSQRKALESSTELNGSHYQENVKAAIATIENCARLVDQLSLYSPNETEDDIASSDLQYLSLYYYMAELILRDSLLDRRTALKRAQEAYEKFLALLDTYNLLSKPDRRLHEQFLSNPNEFSLVSSSDPASRRDTRIVRFKRESQLKSKLAHLSQNPSALENDDGALRDLFLAEIDLNSHSTFHALDLIAQELHILSLAPRETLSGSNATTEVDARKRSTVNQSDHYSDRLDPSISQLLQDGKTGPILSKEGKPLKPFTLLDARQRMQNGVFRPDHRLPTMTIDEYLAEEKRRGGIIERGGENSGRPAIPDEDNLARADEETMKARSWDEFKEENPKGSGNTLNRG